jgi:hypothetical protein
MLVLLPQHQHRSIFARRVACGVILAPVRAVATSLADRVFDVFGDHSYRMDLRG